MKRTYSMQGIERLALALLLASAQADLTSPRRVEASEKATDVAAAPRRTNMWMDTEISGFRRRARLKLIAITLLVVLVAVLALGCSGDGATLGCVTDDGTEENVDLVTMSPAEATSLTVAEVLRRDQRFTQFRKLAEETATAITDSFMEAWDRPEDVNGNKVWMTLFVPTDTAFEALDADVRAAWEEGRLDQAVRYGWIGHHGMDRPYPSSEFVEGVQSNDRGERAVLTLDPLTYAGCPILQTDLLAANGYIHVVGGVGVPADVRASASE
jgi:hypothetical protein